MFDVLTKRELLRIEEVAIPIENQCFKIPNKAGREEALSLHFAILGWYHNHAISPDLPQRTQNTHLAELLGIQPQYKVAYRGSAGLSHAIWGFKFKHLTCIIYHSKRGLQIAVDDIYPDSLILELLRVLCDKLC